MRILLPMAVALPLLTSASFALLPATPALALPQHPTCVITTYYNDAAHDEEVGTRTVCPGTPSHLQGHVTPYHTSERVVLDQGGPGGHAGNGPGGLPCEFLQAGCSNLPVNRFN